MPMKRSYVSSTNEDISLDFDTHVKIRAIPIIRVVQSTTVAQQHHRPNKPKKAKEVPDKDNSGGKDNLEQLQWSLFLIALKVHREDSRLDP